MILKELEKIVIGERDRGASNIYIRNSLKEYLQVYILSFIYTSEDYRKNLIFTGGTCLRHFYDLERLSEDIDFDYFIEPDIEKLKQDILGFLSKKYKFEKVTASIKQKGEQILIKFPVLHDLNLAKTNESNMLYAKIDLSKIPSQNCSVLTTSKSIYGFNFAAKHYDLESLMSGKLHAVLTRRHIKGKDNRESIKGRDFYDLLWFLKKSVQPNIQRLSDMLGEKVSLHEIEQRLDKKVNLFTNKYKSDFESDLTPLLKNPDIILDYFNNYQDEYLRFKPRSFSSKIILELNCKKCGKRFGSGISIERKDFETINLSGNKHTCPHCGATNISEKKDYIF